MTDHTRKETRTAPAQIKVSVSGKPIGEVRVEPEKGWRRWTQDLNVDVDSQVVLEALTSATVDAHLCIDATVRGEAGQ